MHDSNFQSLDSLAERVAALETRLNRMQRRQRGWRTMAAIGAVTTLACLTLWAQNATGPLTVRAPFRIVGAGGKTIFSVTDNGSGAGTLEMKGSTGKSFTAGVTQQGDAFGRWDASNGSALIGTPQGKKDFGIRVLAAGTNTSTIGMVQSSQTSMIAIGRNGIMKIGLAVDAKSAVMGILDNAGGDYLSDFVDRGAGGDMEIANKSGQIVARVDANPNSNEGRANFMNAGGTVLARMGAAGEHGDVVLSSANKAIGVWEMALTGMLH
jgi:hypothetical protein